MMFGKDRRAEKGFVLITFYMILTFLLTLAFGMVVHALAQMHAAQRSQGTAQSFYLAEAAIDQGYQWLKSQAGPPGGTAALVLNGGWQNLGEGTFMVTVDPDDNNPNSFIKRYSIRGWASAGNPAAPVGVSRTDIVVQVESFARFAYLTHSEISLAGQTVWFRTGDRLRGPTHTNGRFSMYGTPTFEGPVSSVSGSVNYFNPPPAGGNNPNFNAGLQLGADSKPYPGSMPASVTNAAAAGGTTFQGNTTITLVSNGTLRVTNAARGLNNSVMPLPANGLLYVNNGTTTLSGTLKGQLTVATTGSVRIPSSVTYSDDPRVNSNSNDLLGIVAGGNVVVTSNAPANVEIAATIMALGTSFTVENYWVGPAKGTLTIYGGVSQAKRGPVGTFNGSTGAMLSGYTKDYRYDNRLQNKIPPYFPLTGNYNALGWNDESNQI